VERNCRHALQKSRGPLEDGVSLSGSKGYSATRSIGVILCLANFPALVPVRAGLALIDRCRALEAKAGADNFCSTASRLVRSLTLERRREGAFVLRLGGVPELELLGASFEAVDMGVFDSGGAGGGSGSAEGGGDGGGGVGENERSSEEGDRDREHVAICSDEESNEGRSSKAPSKSVIWKERTRIVCAS